ncbi:hypothetical protein ACGF3G_28330 [Streptomyces sp. NPDC048179]|uniref:hypothetical protein n=1 Tax=Streptomyces sp. NPDC048179 TaxID=3365506 RepID=UPI0037205FE2
MITTTWKPLESDIDAFLTEFQRRSDSPEPDSAEQFAGSFLAADPNSATVLTRTLLAASLPARRAMFDNAGIGAVRCVDAAQLDLDEHHLLVTADWDAERVGSESLRLESTFLLRRGEEGLRILVYLNHRDITALL